MLSLSGRGGIDKFRLGMLGTLNKVAKDQSECEESQGSRIPIPHNRKNPISSSRGDILGLMIIPGVDSLSVWLLMLLLADQIGGLLVHRFILKRITIRAVVHWLFNRIA